MASRLYNISAIPVPTPDAYVHKYAALCLLSLKLNPQQFRITYDAMLAFTDDVWRSKLDSFTKATFVAAERPHDDWVGLVTVFGPATVQSVGLKPPGTANPDGATVYTLRAMWVHPAHRKQGLGRRLIETVFDWVRRDGEAEEKILVLEVWRSNENAKSLYAAMGFVDVDDGNEQPLSDILWMARPIR